MDKLGMTRLEDKYLLSTLINHYKSCLSEINLDYGFQIEDDPAH